MSIAEYLLFAIKYDYVLMQSKLRRNCSHRSRMRGKLQKMVFFFILIKQSRFRADRISAAHDMGGGSRFSRQ